MSATHTCACRFVMLIDSPVFTRVRLQLLSPGRYPDLMRSMYALLMLCPQSHSFQTLQARLSSVPTLALLKLNDADDGRDVADGAPLSSSDPAAVSVVSAGGFMETAAESLTSSGSVARRGSVERGGGAAAVEMPWDAMLQARPSLSMVGLAAGPVHSASSCRC
jgi:Vacuolar protein 14 C-terminal Fig4p binding